MTAQRRAQVALASITALGLLLRVAASIWHRALHPDEFFQYLEPAWWRLTGAGIEAWEWQDGVRSWVLPFYNGAWLSLLRLLGVQRGATLGFLLQLHWALVNACVIALAWRGGSCLARQLNAAPRAAAPGQPLPGFEGGLLAALLCACFPLLVVYSPHTLSEMPSMLLLLAGLVLTAELVERAAERPAAAWLLRQAALAGALLSFGACLRIANGPLALVPPLWLLATRHYRPLLAMLGAALLPALLFGLVDLFTWGRFAGSFLGYLRFNLIEGKAARFGTQPPWWYLERLWSSAPVGLPLLLPFAFWGSRKSFAYLLSAFGMIAYLSTQPHKEGRFVIGFWPLLFIAAGGALGAWIARVREHPGQGAAASRLPVPRGRWPLGLALALSAVVLGDAARNVTQDYWLNQGRVRCQQWAGAQRDLTGLMVDDPIFAAGSVWLDVPAPQLRFNRSLLSNPLLNYVVVEESSRHRRDVLRAGFYLVFRSGSYGVLRRRPL